MKTIPEPTKRRLVQIVQLLSQQPGKKITSVMLEDLTGWSASLIRRDISFLDFGRGVSNGYDIRELHDVICAALRLEYKGAPAEPCCIAGLGRIGTALLDDSLFEDTRFRIAAGFDSSVNRTEILHSSFPLYPLSHLEQVLSTMKIRFAILAVKDGEAQNTADRLSCCGVKGIVNYTKTVLSVPANVLVENVSPITALVNLAVRTSAGNDLS